jgi:hypothetical protein
MLYRFRVANFGAIRDEQEFDLTISGKVESEPDRQITGPDGVKVARVGVILGANASGKTTVLRALGFLSDFASTSALSPLERPLRFYPFSDPEAQAQTSTLSVEFTADWITPRKWHPFRYTLVAEPGTGERWHPSQRWVQKEHLEYRPSTQWISLIEREGSHARFKREMSRLGGSVPETALARRNVSVISLLQQFVADNPIVDSIRNTLMGVNANFATWQRERRSAMELAETYAKDQEALNALNALIRKADLGIKGVNVHEFQTAGSETTRRWFLFFDHSGLSGSLSAAQESQGTMNFVSLFPVIHATLTSGGLALLDELDSDLHPELLREIVGWFNDPEINKHNAQLLTTCNNPTILDWLRKEEIFFAKKDDRGRTSVYALKDIPGVRRTANFQREYLAGRYGAVPHIG